MTSSNGPVVKKPGIKLDPNGNFVEQMANVKFEDLNILRGATPDDIKHKAHRLCGEYLAGAWLGITADQMVLSRISGGFTNQLYYCGLPDGVKTISDEPREIALRLYGPKHFGIWDEGNERFTDSVCTIIMSEMKVGPKIYGVFPQGEIQEYYRAHVFGEKEESDPVIVKELAQKLARFQSIKVPLKKENVIFKNFRDLHTKMYKRFPDLDQTIAQKNLETLKNKSLLTEVDWCEKVVLALNASESFVHHDFRNMNLIVKEVGGTEGNHLVVCDFEYACHGYRGMDFGTLFCYWGMKGFVKNPLPADNVMKAFFEEYIAEMVKINGEDYLKDKRNSSDFMIKETKIFHLVGQLFGCMFCLGLEDDNQVETFNKENMLHAAEFVFGNYFSFKDQYISENVIPKV